MIREIAISIIAAVTGFMLKYVFDGARRHLARINEERPKQASKRHHIIVSIIRYTVMAVLMTLLFLFVDEGKVFLLLFLALVVLLVLFISRDVLMFMLLAAADSADRERLLDEKLRILEWMENCQITKEGMTKYVARLKEIDEELDNMKRLFR